MDTNIDNKEKSDIPYVYPPNARSAEYRALLETIKTTNECPFCVFPKYHKGEVLPELSGEHWVVGTNHPSYQGSRAHLILITRRHIQKIEELSDEEWSSLHNTFVKTINTFKLNGATLIFRSGHPKHTGGTIGHLHCQIVSGDPENPDYPESGIVSRIG